MEEYDLRSDVMRQRLSRDLFSGTVDTLVEGAQHLHGLEWDAVILVSVCLSLRLVLVPVFLGATAGGVRGSRTMHRRQPGSFSALLCTY